jgi:hypothetical protein
MTNPTEQEEKNSQSFENIAALLKNSGLAIRYHYRKQLNYDY